MVSLKELRRRGLERLKACQNDSPAADVDVVLMSLGFQKSDIIIGEKNVSPQLESEFQAAVARLEKGKPVQQIVGECEFMSLAFTVTRDTLIPRSDTEILVEAVIEKLKSKEAPSIFEVGSGSGCIAVSLAYYLPSARVMSVDISHEALKVARKNAERLGVSDRVEFFEWDIKNGFPTLLKKPDAVVSNPPYIPANDIAELDKKVRDFEPVSALSGGEDGLDFYRIISAEASVKKGGYIAFEVGAGQAAAVAEMLESRFSEIQIKKDLAGIDRVVIGKM